MTQFSPKKTFFPVLVILLLMSGCGGSGSENVPGGESEEFEGCSPDDTTCCTKSEDCQQAGYYCNQTEHRCMPVGSDDDLDGTASDGDAGDSESAQDGLADGDGPETGDDDGASEEEPSDAEEAANEADEAELIVNQRCQYGLDELVHPEKALCMKPYTVVEQVSSHDPAGTCKDTSGLYLYVDGNEQVLMESKRPGCLYRMWFGNPAQVGANWLKFYFDGEKTPRLNSTLADLFSGNTPPFLSPLAGQISDDSYFSYVPVCYQAGLKVTISKPANGYQFTYHTYSSGAGIQTFDPNQDVSAAVSLFVDKIGQDPKPVSGESVIWENGIPKGSSFTVYEDSNPSVINALLVDLTPVTQDILDKTFMEIYWEGKTSPDVNVPLGLFFGSGFGKVDYQGLMVGMSQSGHHYFYFPMPYWKNAAIRLRNNSNQNITLLRFELKKTENTLPESLGHFQAAYTEALPTTSGVDFTALQVAGKGHVVGINLAMESTDLFTKAFLKGDERIYIDGLNTPSLYGTGTDNYFNGNSLWPNSYSNPLFSVSKYDSLNSYQFSARRLLLGDALPFNRSIKIGFQHGCTTPDGDTDDTGGNTVEANYRAVTYYYLSCLEGLSAPTASDAINIGSPTDEAAHNCTFRLSDFADHQNKTYHYEGVDQKKEVTESGRGITGLASDKGYIECLLAVDSHNAGVRLARMLDYGIANQEARVLVMDAGKVGVDFQEAGRWYTPGRNTINRWRDSAFDIPAELTQGASSLKIRFEYAGGEEWNVYKLWSYSYLPVTDQPPKPGTVAEISYSMIGLQAQLAWSAPPGPPPQYYHIYRSKAQVFNCTDETLVGTTNSNAWLDPKVLDANTQYFYRIMAEDCAGNRGNCSDALMVQTGVPPFCFEGEAAYVADQSFPKTAGSIQTKTGLGFSGDQILYFASTNINDTLALTADVPNGAVYQVVVTALKGPQMGIFRLLIDSSLQGSKYDAWAASEESSGEINFGKTNGVLSAGTHQFFFRVTGKHGDVTGTLGGAIGIDQVCLRKYEAGGDQDAY